jgi:putative tricarboxylic transport membrane protein
MKKDRKLRAGENIFGWILLLFSLYILLQAYFISGFSSISSAGTFPMAASAVMVVSSGLILLNNRRLKKPDTKNIRDELVLTVKTVLPSIFLFYIVIVIVYAALLKPLHFLPSSLAFLIISIIYLKGTTVPKTILISISILVFIYILFQYVFRVVLP